MTLLTCNLHCYIISYITLWFTSHVRCLHSYARRDIDFVRHLFDQLVADDREPWADWLTEIYRSIEAVNAFLFVITLACQVAFDTEATIRVTIVNRGYGTGGI